MAVYDVVILGAGAAGMMCAIEAGKRGRRVLVLEKSNKPGKKILMSGGGRCNFTNRYTSPKQFISHNPHFCKSALSRFTPDDFIERVNRHRIAFFEKKLGQLFCVDKSSLIVNMLLNECAENQVDIALNQSITLVEKKTDEFIIHVNDTRHRAASLVVATGGLSIPTLGSSPFGYQIAEQFGLKVYPTRAGLVPVTLHEHDKQRLATLTGIAVETEVHCNHQSFTEAMLFTHRGLSGPAILQMSSYWNPGEAISIQFLPEIDMHAILADAREHEPDRRLKTILEVHFAKRFLSVFYDETLLHKPMRQFTIHQLTTLAHELTHWCIKPNGTEGYRTAEVTLGGVDCDAVSSQRFEAHGIPGLFFIGEVLDVSGWLGGYNFQWAWSSGWAAGQCV